MVDPLAPPGSTRRTTIHRLPEKAVHDREMAYAILDAGLLAHVAHQGDDGLVLTPLGYARDGDRLLMHGSRASRTMRALASGTPAVVNVTLLDGVVLARSLFESSMHYRSVTAFGSSYEIPADEVDAALRVLSEHLLPGRYPDARHPSSRELEATLTIAFPLDEIAVKISNAEPIDTDEDRADARVAALWAGIVPIESRWGTPRADDVTPSGAPAPRYITSWSPPGFS
jgi:nitroimidazol reductase NimA-like FMN-containing flavoprotein (pyridoxamine 5'-phosphate oxidase superfamily)